MCNIYEENGRKLWMDQPTDRKTDSSIAICHPFLDGKGGAEKLPGKADGKQLSIKTAYLHNIGIEK